MLIVERQQRLLDILRERRVAQLDDLAGELGVSSSTVRRDLEALEGEGVARRTHGGAVYTGEDGVVPRGPTLALAGRMTERNPQKEAIAGVAAGMVQPHMTLLLDGGSTVIFAARAITARPIQVVTNSLSIANHFKDDEQVELLTIGGTLYPRTEVMVGPIALRTLEELHADLLFFSLAGLYELEGGGGWERRWRCGEPVGFNLNHDMAGVERAMMRQATRSVMLMDSSKFGRKSLVRVCGAREVDRIVTDEGVGESWRRRLGERLVVAGG